MKEEGGKRFWSIRLSRSDLRISTRKDSRLDLSREEGEDGFIGKFGGKFKEFLNFI